jgi:hypothetical protein
MDTLPSHLTHHAYGQLTTEHLHIKLGDLNAVSLLQIDTPQYRVTLYVCGQLTTEHLHIKLGDLNAVNLQQMDTHRRV